MKLIGALIIIFSSLIIGAELSRGVERAGQSVSALRAVLEHTKNMIECYSLPSGEILRRLDRSVLGNCGYTKSDAPTDFCSFAEGMNVADV